MQQAVRQSKPGDIVARIHAIAAEAREASRMMARATTAEKDEALRGIAQRIRASSDVILEANRRDLDLAVALDAALLDRLALDPERVEAMALGILQVAQLPDPIGAITDLNYRPSGIQVGRMRVPLGVVGIIYESRPNVTADAATLCLKSGN
ncbi:MAG: gamma-glutamyl-phosphate reductase, partial [Gammaproteobacteria bacterium]|nr:gamma-glutamyl-phosphate reductase [Gammaproteobacteria bacterium]